MWQDNPRADRCKPRHGALVHPPPLVSKLHQPMAASQRYKLTIAYRGTRYHGWQAQPALESYKGDPPAEGEGIPTIQEIVARTNYYPLTSVQVAKNRQSLGLADTVAQAPMATSSDSR